MKKIQLLLLLFVFKSVSAQEPILQVGSVFPEMMITHISNAPVKELYLKKTNDKKFYILNFWGTWCPPCIPEMDALAVLQKKNAKNLQVIAISDDSEERKQRYLRNKPSTIWLATDTGYSLYRMLNLAHVGQSAIISPDKKIIALVRTDSINQRMIDKLLKGEDVPSNAGLVEAGAKVEGDFFGVDSLMTQSFTIRGYQQGSNSMSKHYPDGPLRNRRRSWWNVGIGNLYRAAYGIRTYGVQEFYDSTVKKEEVNAHNMKNKEALYCVDILVKPGQEDSLSILLQQYLQRVLSVKVRSETKILDVYILKPLPGAALALKAATGEKSSYGFSGRGYDGTKIKLADFATDYLSNELGLPVLDETGLPGYYDIKTDVEQRDWNGILKSIQQLGLTVEKAKREMPVIVYYK